MWSVASRGNLRENTYLPQLTRCPSSIYAYSLFSLAWQVSLLRAILSCSHRQNTHGVMGSFINYCVTLHHAVRIIGEIHVHNNQKIN